MQQYEQLIYQQSGVLPVKYTTSQLHAPQPNSLVDHFTRFTFAQDPNQLHLYQQAQSHQVQQANPQPKAQHMDQQLGSQFVPLQSNYLEYNANSKTYGQIQQMPNYLKDVHDTANFQNTQLQYISALNDPQPSDFAKTLKSNIQQLGGIEDTIGNMQGSLNQYEIKHLVNKNIKHYPNPQPSVQQVQEQKYQQQFGQVHPFIYNPAEDQNRYNQFVDHLKPPQPIESQQQQTYQSQFYLTNQFQDIQQYQQQVQLNTLHFQSIENSKRMRNAKLQALQNK